MNIVMQMQKDDDDHHCSKIIEWMVMWSSYFNWEDHFENHPMNIQSSNWCLKNQILFELNNVGVIGNLKWQLQHIGIRIQ